MVKREQVVAEMEDEAAMPLILAPEVRVLVDPEAKTKTAI
jgi:hypothetical protein